MYRIIGIFEDEAGNKHAKLIKKEALNTAYAWHSDNQTNVDWNNSDLYKGLNGDYFLNNTKYPYMQDSAWTNKIATWNYTMTNTKTSELSGPNYNTITIENLYLHELNRNSKTSNAGEWKNLNTKISLMYVSDYALSLGSDALNYISSSNSSEMKKGWLFSSTNQWTITRFGISSSGSTNYGWFVRSSGVVDKFYVGYPDVKARPVFFLESKVELASNSGDGSITNPYMILN